MARALPFAARKAASGFKKVVRCMLKRVKPPLTTNRSSILQRPHIMLVFSNPGIIDPRLITTIGVNVKEGPSPIGFFGSGLKYAIAVTLRLGGSISIITGGDLYTFYSEQEEIRGKSFGFVYMWKTGSPRERLGFTTDLGKTWEPWMVYRELLCNARDEGGEVFSGKGANQDLFSMDSSTSVLVRWSILDEVHSQRDKWFLPEEVTPIWADASVQVLPGPSNTIFYRGIAVGHYDRPSLFTYNLISSWQLTEDRTLRDMFYVPIALANSLCHCSDKKLLEKVLFAPEHQFESTFNWDYNYDSPSEVFVSLVKDSMKDPSLSKKALQRCKHEIEASIVPEEYRPSDLEWEMLTTALAFVRGMGFPCEEQIELVESLGENVFGMAKERKIWISRRAFGMGTKFLASTLIEEHLHLAHGVQDCSRAMQNLLFERIMDLGEKLSGELL
jgi:hypothetical protein